MVGRNIQRESKLISQTGDHLPHHKHKAELQRSSGLKHAGWTKILDGDELFFNKDQNIQLKAERDCDGFCNWTDKVTPLVIFSQVQMNLI